MCHEAVPFRQGCQRSSSGGRHQGAPTGSEMLVRRFYVGVLHNSHHSMIAASTSRRAPITCVPTRRYLLDPHVEVPYLTGVAGEYLHPDLVNFDILARENYSAFKSRMLGEDTAPRRLCVEPSDDSVERLTKAQLIEALAAHISASTHGAERDDRMRELRRVSSRPKADVKELWLEVTGGVTDYRSSIDD